MLCLSGFELYSRWVPLMISFAMSSAMTWELSDGSLSNWKRNAIAKLKAQQLSVRIAVVFNSPVRLILRAVPYFNFFSCW